MYILIQSLTIFTYSVNCNFLPTNGGGIIGGKNIIWLVGGQSFGRYLTFNMTSTKNNNDGTKAIFLNTIYNKNICKTAIIFLLFNVSYTWMAVLKI